MALGIFICRPPWSFGKVKSAVDVFGDICQASLLHRTKAAVSLLNSFSGQIITGPEKARRGARVHSINLRLVSIERSLFFRRKYANSVILSSPLGSAIQPYIISNAKESNRCFAMDYLQGRSVVFYS